MSILHLPANAALLPTPGRAIRPASQRGRCPGRRLVSMAKIAGIRNFHRLGLRRPNKAEGVAADLHVAEGLGDLRHVAGDALAAGASRGMMGVLLDCCRMRPVLCIGPMAG